MNPHAFPANTKTSENIGGNVLEMFLWKVFLMFSEHLCGSFPHNHQEIFTDHLISDYPILPITPPNSYRPSLILCISGCFMFCVNNVEHVNYRYMYIMKNLLRTFPTGWNCPNLVGTF